LDCITGGRSGDGVGALPHPPPRDRLGGPNRGGGGGAMTECGPAIWLLWALVFLVVSGGIAVLCLAFVTVLDR